MNPHKQKLLKSYMKKKEYGVDKEELWDELSKSLPVGKSSKLWHKPFIATVIIASTALIYIVAMYFLKDSNSVELNKLEYYQKEQKNIEQKELEVVYTKNIQSADLDKSAAKEVTENETSSSKINVEDLDQTSPPIEKIRTDQSQTPISSNSEVSKVSINDKIVIAPNENAKIDRHGKHQTEITEPHTSLNDIPINDSTASLKESIYKNDKTEHQRLDEKLNNTSSTEYFISSLLSSKEIDQVNSNYPSLPVEGPALSTVIINKERNGFLQIEFNVGIGLSSYKANTSSNGIFRFDRAAVREFGMQFKYIVDHDYFFAFNLEDARRRHQLRINQPNGGLIATGVNLSQFSSSFKFGKYFNIAERKVFLATGPILSLSKGSSQFDTNSLTQQLPRFEITSSINQEAQLGGLIELGTHVRIMDQPFLVSLQYHKYFGNINSGDVNFLEDRNTTTTVGNYINTGSYPSLRVAYIANF